MTETVDTSLRDGTLVRHKSKGYEGKIEGTTGIKSCFTKGGESLSITSTKESFQYRIVVSGQARRFVAPVEDLEIVDAPAQLICVRCSSAFRSNPSIVGKAGGRCACGGWICPVCLGCQAEESDKENLKPCLNQRKRLQKKTLKEKKK